MTYSAARTFDAKYLDAARFLDLGAAYEKQEDLISAFGYYVVAASLAQPVAPHLAEKIGYLGYRIGDLAFSIKWMIEAISSETSDGPRNRRSAAIKNMLKILGVTVNAAELSHTPLKLPPLLEPIPSIRDDHRRTCLLISDVADVTENILVAIPEHSDYRAYVFRYAELARMIPAFNLDRFLVTLVRVLAPDLILFRHAGLSQRKFDPRVETLRIIRLQSGIPVVGIYCDLVKPSFTQFCHAYLPGLDGVTTLDSPFDDVAATQQGSLVHNAWAPLPASVYYPSDGARPIDIGFVGRSAAHYRQRQYFLNGLQTSGIKVEIHGSDFGSRLTLDEMAGFLRSCKIVLNFSATAIVSSWDTEINRAGYQEADHVKGRVFEAIACGALLFESRNDRTRQFFTPGEHYVEFDDLADLKQKLAYFLANESHRRRIAEAATAHYMAHYTGSHYWQGLERMIGDIRGRRAAPPGREEVTG